MDSCQHSYCSIEQFSTTLSSLGFAPALMHQPLALYTGQKFFTKLDLQKYNDCGIRTQDHKFGFCSKPLTHSALCLKGLDVKTCVQNLTHLQQLCMHAWNTFCGGQPPYSGLENQSALRLLRIIPHHCLVPIYTVTLQLPELSLPTTHQQDSTHSCPSAQL